MSELDLTYPTAPGYKRTETSFEASICMRERAEFLRSKCLALLKEKSLTADEVAEALGQTVLSIRPRISELRAWGQVMDTGERRRNAGGHRQIVWRAYE